MSSSTVAPSAMPNGSQATNGTAKQQSTGTVAKKHPLIEQSTKLVDGGADKLDVWTIFTPANMPPDAINLGQGFMSASVTGRGSVKPPY